MSRDRSRSPAAVAGVILRAPLKASELATTAQRWRETEEGRYSAATVEALMLYWAVVFFIIALVAGFLGFGGVASAASGIAQVLFFVFLVVFLIALVMGLVRRRPPTV